MKCKQGNTHIQVTVNCLGKVKVSFDMGLLPLLVIELYKDLQYQTEIGNLHCLGSCTLFIDHQCNFYIVSYTSLILWGFFLLSNTNHFTECTGPFSMVPLLVRLRCIQMAQTHLLSMLSVFFQGNVIDRLGGENVFLLLYSF